MMGSTRQKAQSANVTICIENRPSLIHSNTQRLLPSLSLKNMKNVHQFQIPQTAKANTNKSFTRRHSQGIKSNKSLKSKNSTSKANLPTQRIEKKPSSKPRLKKVQGPSKKLSLSNRLDSTQRIRKVEENDKSFLDRLQRLTVYTRHSNCKQFSQTLKEYVRVIEKDLPSNILTLINTLSQRIHNERLMHTAQLTKLNKELKESSKQLNASLLQRAFMQQQLESTKRKLNCRSAGYSMSSRATQTPYEDYRQVVVELDRMLDQEKQKTKVYQKMLRIIKRQMDIDLEDILERVDSEQKGNERQKKIRVDVRNTEPNQADVSIISQHDEMADQSWYKDKVTDNNHKFSDQMHKKLKINLRDLVLPE